MIDMREADTDIMNGRHSNEVDLVKATAFTAARVKKIPEATSITMVHP
jgi:hypothetical protein